MEVFGSKLKKTIKLHILSISTCLISTYAWHTHILTICICCIYTYAEHLPILNICVTPVHVPHIGYAMHIHNIRELIMRTVSIFKNGNNRAIRLPRDLDFEGVSELEIVREGNNIILRPVRPTWSSFLELEKADPDFMAKREDIVSDEGRFNL